MSANIYGYVRVSTRKQNEDRQLIALEDLMGAFLSDVVLQVLSFVAENERANIRQRQAEGIAAAKAKGVHFGPQPRTLPDGFEELRQAWRSGQITLRAAAEACGIPKSTFRDASLRAEMAVNR